MREGSRGAVGLLDSAPGPAFWIVETTASRRFPVRVSIEQGGRLLLAVRAQSAWPGPGQQVFCLRERELDPSEPLEQVERVPIAQITRVGRKLAIVLDRPTRKRCELLTVVKPSKDGEGSYEQVFFRTESGIRAHRSRTRMELREDQPGPLSIAIDSAERYPWRFPGARIERRKLRVGDYALLGDDGVETAVLERKTFDNLLGDIGALQALHHQLADLAGYERAAVVIEAQYADFLDERRVRGRWPVAYLARVLAEISALHPRLPVVFAGNRKLANLWSERFFAACRVSEGSQQLELVRETLAGYDPTPRAAGLDDQIRREILEELVPDFAFRDLATRFPEVPVSRLRRVLGELKREGRVTRSGPAGRGVRWTVRGTGGLRRVGDSL